MSFTQTPLSQSRRVDQQTFFKRNNSQSSISQPKPPPDFAQDNALARFNRIKEQQLQERGSRPKTITSPPRSPEKLRDTTVNVASAFHQAAESSTMNVPRATSVEYEQQAQHAKRLPPSNSIHRTGASLSRKPLSNARTGLQNGRPINQPPPSEPEPASNGRGRSPFVDALASAAGAAVNAAGQVAYYVRQRSQEPAGNISNSYDYSAEDREILDRTRPSASVSAANRAHKKGKMSEDNKAYAPSSDEEYDDDNVSDEERKRGRKKKKLGTGGPLTTLPRIAPDKARRRKAKRRNGEADDDDEAAASGSDISRSRTVPQFDDQPSSFMDDSLASIPEEPPAPKIPSPAAPPRRRSRSRSRTRDRPSFSLGNLLGVMFRPFVWAITLIVRTLAAVMELLGRVLGLIVGILFARPYTWIARSKAPIGTYLISILFIGIAITALRNTSFSSLPGVDWSYFIPSSSPSHGFQAPENVKELLDRLQKLEAALESIPTLATDDISKRIGKLEGRVQRESERVIQVEKVTDAQLREGLSALRSDIQGVVQKQEAIAARPPVVVPPSNEGLTAEEKEKMKKLEEKVVEVESGLTKVIADQAKSSSAGVGSWWDRLAMGKSADLKIRASDGSDVTRLIERLVADSIASDNGFHQTDYASYSTGARVIPELTSETLTIHPPSLPGRLVGWLTGSGSAIARPPVTALHHEVRSGYCWAFPGSSGQLGVLLAAGTVRPTTFVVEHVRREFALDPERPTAPRDMEVWGLIDGRDNFNKLNNWRQMTASDPAFMDLDPTPPPKGIPRGYIRLANFTYSLDPGAPSAQTFDVAEHVRELGLDFGIVIFRILNNWAREEDKKRKPTWSCLYRVRVFGENS
ncbi:hypothetical protein DL96DRAFT_1215569 [Flagelloscypha sp. PMI_526]|nr:hypothetical protein DL96DRAFT_1215569 [Flagelloscypha sp. PMI_526]